MAAQDRCFNIKDQNWAITGIQVGLTLQDIPFLVFMNNNNDPQM